jgi:hypothetical protein
VAAPPENNTARPAQWLDGPWEPRAAYFIVGMTNSAATRVPVGQRVVVVLRRV